MWRKEISCMEGMEWVLLIFISPRSLHHSLQLSDPIKWNLLQETSLTNFRILDSAVKLLVD